MEKLKRILGNKGTEKESNNFHQVIGRRRNSKVSKSKQHKTHQDGMIDPTTNLVTEETTKNQKTGMTNIHGPNREIKDELYDIVEAFKVEETE